MRPPDNVSGDVNVLQKVTNPIVRIKNSSYGHSQDFLYDNLDQYAWHELDSATITGTSMDKNQILDLEKFIQDMPNRRLKAIAQSRAKDENWNHWQRCLAWFPMKIVKKTRDATTNYGYTEYDSGNMRRHRKSQSPVSPKHRLNESFRPIPSLRKRRLLVVTPALRSSAVLPSAVLPPTTHG